MSLIKSDKFLIMKSLVLNMIPQVITVFPENIYVLFGILLLLWQDFKNVRLRLEHKLKVNIRSSPIYKMLVTVVDLWKYIKIFLESGYLVTFEIICLFYWQGKILCLVVFFFFFVFFRYS